MSRQNALERRSKYQYKPDLTMLCMPEPALSERETERVGASLIAGWVVK